jgi:RNA polymerase sigma factor (sigma-70 family)
MIEAVIEKDKIFKIGMPTEDKNQNWEDDSEFFRLLTNFFRQSIIKDTEMGEISQKVRGEKNPIGTVQMSRENAEIIFKKFVKQAKRLIKKKIFLYEPLEYKVAVKRFLEWIRENEFKVIREMPENGDSETYLERIVRNFLIENAYYILEEKHIRRRVMNKLGVLEPQNIKLMEIIDFIIEGIEREGMKRLKKFRENSNFKTYLFTVVSRLYNDYWRHRYKVEKQVSKFETDFEEIFDPPQNSPLEELIHLDDEAFKADALALIPEILKTLEADQRVAIKLKYERKMKLSAVSRTLGLSRFKTEQFIKEIERRIAMEINARINTENINKEAPRVGAGRRQ